MADGAETPNKHEDSLKLRYLYKLGANLVGLLAAFVTQAIVPRALGPVGYGNFSFLTNFFSQTVSFCDMGTSVCYYTMLSQRQHERAIIRFYLLFFCFIVFVTILFVAGSGMGSIDRYFWPGQEALYIWMAVFWALCNFAVMVLFSTADAFGFTVATENMRIYNKCISVGILLIMYGMSIITLKTYFIYQLFLFVLMSLMIMYVLHANKLSFESESRLSWVLTKKYAHEFFTFSNPLFTYSLIGLLSGLFDRWLLQVFAGSAQQGFYGLSYQIGAICFLFTSAMAPLLMREFSISFSKNDFAEMRRLFNRYIPLLYSIAAFFSCFLAVEAQRVVQMFGGREFAGALLPVTIMALYPVHQTYGQLSNSIFLATGQTKLYRNIGITFTIIGSLATYFLVAPNRYGGFAAGATGLAVKMVSVQFFVVNAYFYYNTRFLNISFKKYFTHQILCIAILLLISFIASMTTNSLSYFKESVIPGFIVSGIIYTILVASAGIISPRLFGLRRDDLLRLSKALQERFSKSTGH